MSTIHTVRSGDSMWAIAQRHQVELKDLIAANPQVSDPSLIHPGQQLTIPDHRDDTRPPTAPQTSSPGASGVGPDAPEADAQLYTVRPGDTLSGIAARHGVTLQQLIGANLQITNPNLIHPGDAIMIPAGGQAANAPATSAPTAPTAPDVPTVGGADGPRLEAFPIAGGRFNIGWDPNWGEFGAGRKNNTDFYTRSDPSTGHVNGHLGNDIFAPRGAPLVAPVTGEIVGISRDDSGLGGRTVTIKRGNHYFYLAHLDSVADNLRVGDQITAGTPVGTVGNSGSARGTEPHLHFSIYQNNNYYDTTDPYQYLTQILEAVGAVA